MHHKYFELTFDFENIDSPFLYLFPANSSLNYTRTIKKETVTDVRVQNMLKERLKYDYELYAFVRKEFALLLHKLNMRQA